MKDLIQFINEARTGVNDLLEMISDFLNKKDVEKKDIIVTAKFCSGLKGCLVAKEGRRFFYTEFKDNKLSKLGVLDFKDHFADIWSKDEGVNRIEDDDFNNEFGYLLKNLNLVKLDVRIWEDPKGVVIDNID